MNRSRGPSLRLLLVAFLGLMFAALALAAASEIGGGRASAAVQTSCAPDSTDSTVEDIVLGDSTTTISDSGGTLSVSNPATIASCSVSVGSLTALSFSVGSGVSAPAVVIDDTATAFPCTLHFTGTLSAGTTPVGTLEIKGANGHGVDVGSSGINIDPTTCTTYAAQTLSGVASYLLTAGTGPVTLSAGGQGGTGGPATVTTTLDGTGSGAADFFVAGDGNETFKSSNTGSHLDFSQVTCPGTTCSLAVNQSNGTLSSLNLANNVAQLSFATGSTSGKFSYDFTSGGTKFNDIAGNANIPTTLYAASGATVTLEGNVTVLGTGGGGNAYTITANGSGNQVTAGPGSETFTVTGSNMTFTGAAANGSATDTFTVTGDSNVFKAGTAGDAFNATGTGETVDFSSLVTTAGNPLSIDAGTGTASLGSTNYSFSGISQITGATSGNTAFTAGVTGGFSLTGQGSGNTATFNPSNAIVANLSGASQTLNGFTVDDGQVLVAAPGVNTACVPSICDTLTDITNVTGPIFGSSTFYGGASGTAFSFTGRGNGNTFLGDSANGACPTTPGCAYTVKTSPSATGNVVQAGAGTESFTVTGSNLTLVGSTGTTTFTVTGSSNTFRAGTGPANFYDTGSGNTADFSNVQTNSGTPLYIDVTGGPQTIGSLQLSSGEASTGSGGVNYFFQSQPNGLPDPFTTIIGPSSQGYSRFFVGSTPGLTLQGNGTGNTLTFVSNTVGVVVNLSGGGITSPTGFVLPVSGDVLVTGATTGTCSATTCDLISGIFTVTGPPSGNSTFYAGPLGATYNFTSQGSNNLFVGGTGPDVFTGSGSGDVFDAGPGGGVFQEAPGGTGNTVDFSGVTPSPGYNLLVNVSGTDGTVLNNTAGLVSGNIVSTTWSFAGAFSTFKGTTSAPTTFWGGFGGQYTFIGQGSGDKLDFSKPNLVTHLFICVVAGPGCSSSGTAQITSGQNVSFSGIEQFVGLSNSGSETTFVADDNIGGLTFTGSGGTNTADFSAASAGVNINLALSSNNVSFTRALPPTPDTLTGISQVYGSTAGSNTFTAGSTKEFFGDTGTSKTDTVDFSNVNAGNGSPLTVNVSPVGTPDQAVLSGVIYTFSPDVTTFIGSLGGYTTFLAGSAGGFTFVGQNTNNSVSFASDTNPVDVNLSSATWNGVGAGQVLVGPAALDQLLGTISAVTGSASGGDTFVAGPTSVSFFVGKAGNSGETIDFSNLPSPVVVNVSASGQNPQATAFGTASSAGAVYDFTSFDATQITFVGSKSGSTFYAGSVGDTFEGLSTTGQDELSFEDAPGSTLTVCIAAFGPACPTAGVAHPASGSPIHFSGITTFAGLSGAATTSTFVSGDGAGMGGLKFVGKGGKTVADFSPAANPVRIDLSTTPGTVTFTGGTPPAADTLTGISDVFGSSNGGNTFIAGASSGSFGDNGTTTNWDTLDLSKVNAGNGSVLTVNVSVLGNQDHATLPGGTVDIAFSAQVRTIRGSTGGYTAFVADNIGNFSFLGQGSNNSVSFASDPNSVIVNLAGVSAYGVPGGAVEVAPGLFDTISDIPTVTGSAVGGDTFVAGTGSETYLSGKPGAAETVDFTKLPVAVTVNVSTPGLNPGGAAYGTAISSVGTYDFTNFASAPVTFNGSPSGSTFYAGSAPDTFNGFGSKDSLSFADASGSSLIICTVASGPCTTAGTASLGSGTTIGFTGIEGFTGLSGSGTTTSFVAGTPVTALTFTGMTGGFNSADFSGASSGIRMDLSSASNNVSFAGTSITDTVTGVSNVVGSSQGHNYFVTGSGSETFTDPGAVGQDTIDFSRITTTSSASGGQLTINDTRSGSPSAASLTAVFGAATYTFSSTDNAFTSFVGAASGYTTFLAPDATGGVSFQGEGLGNTVSFAAVTSALTVDMTTGIAQLADATGIDLLEPFGGQLDVTNLIGGTNANTFYGNLTGTTFSSSSATNTLSYLESVVPVTVDMTTTTVSGLGRSADHYAFGSSTPTIEGSPGQDTFVIGTSAAVIQGGGGYDQLDLSRIPASSGSTGAVVNMDAGSVTGQTISGITFTACTSSPTAVQLCLSKVTGSAQNDVFTLNRAQLTFPGQLTIDGRGGADSLDLSQIPGPTTIRMPSAPTAGCVLPGATAGLTSCPTSPNVVLIGITNVLGSSAGGDYVYVGSGTLTVNEAGGTPGTLDLTGSPYGTSVSVGTSTGTISGTATNSLATLNVTFTGFDTFVGSNQCGAGGTNCVSDTFTQTGPGDFSFVGGKGPNTLNLTSVQLSGAMVTLSPGAGCAAGNSNGSIALSGVVNDTFTCMSQVSSASGLTYLVNPGESISINGGGTGKLELCSASLACTLPTSGAVIDLTSGTAGGAAAGTVSGGGYNFSFSGMSTVVGTGLGDLWKAGPGNYKLVDTGSINGITFAGMGGPVTVNESGSPYTVPGTTTTIPAGTAVSSFGTIQLTGITNVTATNSYNDIIVAGSGPATLLGGGGNDRFVLTGGTDFVYAGTGSAILDLSLLPGPVVLDLGQSSLQSLGSGNGYLALLGGSFATVYGSTNSGNQIWGGNGTMTITGGSVADWLAAGNGTQTLNSGGGNDTLVAGVGNDNLVGVNAPVTFVAGQGNDTLTSNTTGNTLSYAGAPAPIQVNLTTGIYTVPAGEPFAGTTLNPQTATGGYGATVNLANAGISSLVGTGGGDVYVAGNGDTIFGNGGDDLFVVDGGNNTLYAGNGTHSTFLFVAAGSNVINGGGASTVDFSQATSAVTVDLQGSQPYATGGFGGFQSLSGILNIVGARASGDKLIAGAKGATVISFGVNDFLQAGPGGGDTLVNDGTGGDTFCVQASCAAAGTTTGGGDTLIATRGGAENYFFANNGVADTIEVAPGAINQYFTDPNDKIVVV